MNFKILASLIGTIILVILLTVGTVLIYRNKTSPSLSKSGKSISGATPDTTSSRNDSLNVPLTTVLVVDKSFENVEIAHLEQALQEELASSSSEANIPTSSVPQRKVNPEVLARYAQHKLKRFEEEKEKNDEEKLPSPVGAVGTPIVNTEVEIVKREEIQKLREKEAEQALKYLQAKEPALYKEYKLPGNKSNDGAPILPSSKNVRVPESPTTPQPPVIVPIKDQENVDKASQKERIQKSDNEESQKHKQEESLMSQLKDAIAAGQLEKITNQILPMLSNSSSQSKQELEFIKPFCTSHESEIFAALEAALLALPDNSKSVKDWLQTWKYFLKLCSYDDRGLKDVDSVSAYVQKVVVRRLKEELEASKTNELTATNSLKQWQKVAKVFANNLLKELQKIAEFKSVQNAYLDFGITSKFAASSTATPSIIKVNESSSTLLPSLKKDLELPKSVEGVPLLPDINFMEMSNSKDPVIEELCMTKKQVSELKDHVDKQINPLLDACLDSKNAKPRDSFGKYCSLFYDVYQSLPKFPYHAITKECHEQVPTLLRHLGSKDYANHYFLSKIRQTLLNVSKGTDFSQHLKSIVQPMIANYKILYPNLKHHQRSIPDFDSEIKLFEVLYDFWNKNGSSGPAKLKSLKLESKSALLPQELVAILINAEEQTFKTNFSVKEAFETALEKFDQRNDYLVMNELLHDDFSGPINTEKVLRYIPLRQQMALALGKGWPTAEEKSSIPEICYFFDSPNPLLPYEDVFYQIYMAPLVAGKEKALRDQFRKAPTMENIRPMFTLSEIPPPFRKAFGNYAQTMEAHFRDCSIGSLKDMFINWYNLQGWLCEHAYDKELAVQRFGAVFSPSEKKRTNDLFKAVLHYDYESFIDESISFVQSAFPNDLTLKESKPYSDYFSNLREWIYDLDKVSCERIMVEKNRFPAVNLDYVKIAERYQNRMGILNSFTSLMINLLQVPSSKLRNDVFISIIKVMDPADGPEAFIKFVYEPMFLHSLDKSAQDNMEAFLGYYSRYLSEVYQSSVFSFWASAIYLLRDIRKVRSLLSGELLTTFDSFFKLDNNGLFLFDKYFEIRKSLIELEGGAGRKCLFDLAIFGQKAVELKKVRINAFKGDASMKKKDIDLLDDKVNAMIGCKEVASKHYKQLEQLEELHSYRIHNGRHLCHPYEFIKEGNSSVDKPIYKNYLTIMFKYYFTVVFNKDELKSMQENPNQFKKSFLDDHIEDPLPDEQKYLAQFGINIVDWIKQNVTQIREAAFKAGDLLTP